MKKTITALYILIFMFVQLLGSEGDGALVEEKVDASESVHREYSILSQQSEEWQILSSTQVYGAFDHLTVNNNDERRWLLQTQAGSHILNEIIIKQYYRETTGDQSEYHYNNDYPELNFRETERTEHPTDFDTHIHENELEAGTREEESAEVSSYDFKPTERNNRTERTRNGGNGHIANVVQNGAENAAVQTQTNGITSVATIRQIGDHNIAKQTQDHTKLNKSEIVQEGENNQATQEQSGSNIMSGWNNRAVIHQESNGHTAHQVQSGIGGNRAEIHQKGRGHNSSAEQSGIGNTAEQTQTGGRSFTATIEQNRNRNTAIQVQEGTQFLNVYSGNSEVYIKQNGIGNTAGQYQKLPVIVSGWHNAVIDQTGNNNTAEQRQIQGLRSNLHIAQTGRENAAQQYQQRTKFNTAEIIQSGDGNYAEQTQSSGRILSDWKNTAVIHQTGNENRAAQSQSGIGGNYVVVKQTGNNNTAEQTQSGWLNRSSVEQKGDNNIAVVRQRN